MQRYGLNNNFIEDAHLFKVPTGKYILYTDHLVKVGKLVAERNAAQIQNKFLAQEILIVREENRLLKEEFLERGAVWQDFVDRGQIPKVQGKPNPILPEEFMDKEWFGKGCKYLSAQWENHDTPEDSEPVLKFCNHKDNPEDTEGNCRNNICPLLVAVFGES